MPEAIINEGRVKAMVQPEKAFELTRQDLTLRFFLWYFAYTVAFTVLEFFNNAFHAILITVIAATGTLISLGLIRWKRDISLASIIFSVCNFFTTTCYILVAKEPVSILFGIWYVLLIIFAHLNLGKRWSIPISVCIVIVFNIVAYNKFQGRDFWVDTYLSNNIYHLSVLSTLALAFGLILFIIRKFVDGRIEVDKELSVVINAYRELNEELSATFESLKHNQDQLKAIIEAIPDSLVRLNKSGEILQVGPIGDGAESVQVKLVDQLPLKEAQKAEIIEKMGHTLKTGEMSQTEIDYMAYGEERIFEARYVRSGNDEIISIVRDITERKRSDKALEESKYFTEKVLNTNPNIIWIHDLESDKIVFVSSAHERILGFDYNFMSGSMTDFMNSICHADDVNSFLTHIEDIKNNRIESPVSVLELRAKDIRGSCHWLRTHFTVFSKTSDGRIKQILCTAQDVSEQKAIEEALRLSEKRLQADTTRLEAIMESTDNMIVSIDKDHLINAFNSSYYHIVLAAYNIEIHKGDDLIALFENVPDTQPFVKNVKRALNGEQFKTTSVFSPPNSPSTYLETTYYPIRNAQNGEIEGASVFVKDVSGQARYEEELRQAKEKAEQASMAKAHFLSTMSHEIRTPMNAVIGFTHLLMQEQMNAQQAEYLNILQFSANHLLALINDILDYSKIEAGKIELEEVEFDLLELLNGMYNIFIIKAREKNIDLKVSYKLELKNKLIGDPVRLGQILTNLLSNAIKFTEKGEVVLEYSITEEGNNEVSIRFAVSDTGIGIPQDKMEIIFDSFTQASSDTTRRYGGTGLGLSISKKLVEMQGGMLNVDSVPGKGSIFSFTIHYKTGAEISNRINGTNGPIPQTQKLLTGLRVLLVEDNEFNTRLVQRFLSKWGIEVDTAADGEKGVEKVLTNKYDVILMDLQMPGISGYDATRIIRGQEDIYYQELPIVAMTASVSVDVKTEVLNKGMDDYITKPFNPEDLYKILHRYLTKLK